MSETLFWSRRGQVACAEHAPTAGSDDHQRDRWCEIPSVVAGRHGSRYQCQFCASERSPIRHATRAATRFERAQASRASLCVLLVEDSSDDVEAYSEALHEHGIMVIAAPDGKQGFEKALEWMPSVILLDVMLPDSNGIDVCRRLKADIRTQQIPVVALSALSDQATKAQAIAAGCSSYLVKPCMPPQLIDRVRAISHVAQHS